MQTGQAEAILPALDALLKEHGVAYSQLDLIAVTRGPGSFTGVRIGISVAKALALAHDIHLAGVNRLAVLAAAGGMAAPDTPVRVCIDARRGECFVQAFGPAGRAGARAPKGEPALLPADADVSGDGGYIQISSNVPGSATDYAHAFQALARVAVPRQHSAIKPLYVRPPDAKLPRKAALSVGAAN